MIVLEAKDYEKQRHIDAYFFPAVALWNRHNGKGSKKVYRFFGAGGTELLADFAGLSDQLRGIRPISHFPALRETRILLIWNICVRRSF